MSLLNRPAELTIGKAVDWRFAATVGARLARPGPPATDYTRRQVIADLAEFSRIAEGPVRDVTGLRCDRPVAEARVVDRAEWIRAAADSMCAMTGGATGAVNAMAGGAIGAVNAVPGRLAGAQTGAVLAFVSTGILGQYDPFSGDDGGCLLLVYPNVISVERQLRLVPKDFRLWVCLHEVTHRVQFTANGSGHLRRWR